MNEQIRELALEVFSFKHKTEPNELDPGHHMDHLYKFAELIVRECIDVVSDCDVEYCTRPQQARAWIASEIKEHFGVEE